jgi:selenide, water dikinase
MPTNASADVTEKRLTDYADCAGCASKFDAADLDALMGELTPSDDPRVLVDFRTADDAGVYRWNGDQAIVQTVDFFTPIVDDPYVFGRIAAVNALSDVYAMGATPRTALAIAALPKNGPSPDVIRAIFRGGADVLREAGVALLGGHTVSDPEVKFGYAVTGEVQADRILTNAGARPGDALFLTKPLGTGIIVRARKYGRGETPDFQAAVDSMVRLNDTAAAAAVALPPGTVGACTDVTGFGLVGHASEIASASGVTLLVDSEQLPVLPGVERLAAEFLPCGGRANLKHFKHLKVAANVRPERHLVCLDPQTSGGLLLSVRNSARSPLIGHFTQYGLPFAEIGRVIERETEGTLVRLD